jgi:hypothetical protein
MNRRGFLGAMLGGMAAPAIVKAEHLMKIVAPKQEIILPFKLRHQNSISGAHILDMDINSIYDQPIQLYNREKFIAEVTSDFSRLGYDAKILNLGGFINV